MTFKERLRKDHQNNVRCFGKVPTIILYVWVAILILFAGLISILNLICNNDRLIIVFGMVASIIGILAIFYIIIISRFEEKGEDKQCQENHL